MKHLLGSTWVNAYSAVVDFLTALPWNQEFTRKSLSSASVSVTRTTSMVNRSLVGSPELAIFLPLCPLQDHIASHTYTSLSLRCPASETWTARARWYYFVLQKHPHGGEYNSGQVKVGSICLIDDDYCHPRQSICVNILKYNNYRTLSINQCERRLRPSAPIFLPFSHDGFYLPFAKTHDTAKKNIYIYKCPNQIQERHVNTPDAS
jgi:hypothetical protein